MAFLECNFFATALGLCTAMNVILPDEAPPPGGWSVLYLLHGLSDDHSIWARRTSVERYVGGRGLVVVMPAVHRSFYVDMAYGGAYGTFVADELPELVARWFPVSVRREDTCVAGLSMGGYGAFRLALSRPEQYGAAASLSGALDMATRVRNSTGDARALHRLAFGDDPDIAGTPHDLLYLAAEVARTGAPRPRLFQSFGTEDFLYEDNIRARDGLRALGMDLAYEEGPGAHEWGFWDAGIRRVLDWMGAEAR